MFRASSVTNLTAAARNGTQLTAHATPHTEAVAWTEIIADTGAEAEGFAIAVRGPAVNATDTGMLLDIAVGAAASEVEIVTDYSIGQATIGVGGNDATLGKAFFFARRVPANSRISARIRGAVTADVCQFEIHMYQGVVHLEDVGNWTTYGISTAASRGTSVPSGNGGFGAWTAIGTTSADHNLFAVAFDLLSDTTIGSGDIVVQLGYGSSAPDAGGTAIDALFHFQQAANPEGICGPVPMDPVYANLPSGTQLWARIAGVDTENRGIAIYGAEGTVVSGVGSTVVINRDNDMDIRQIGSTDQSYTIEMVNDDGSPATGLAHTDITEAWYIRQNSAPVEITPANLAAIDSAHTDGGWEEYGDPEAPGEYRFDLPDAFQVTGVPRGKIVVQSASAKGKLIVDFTVDNPRAAAATAAEISAQILADWMAEDNGGLTNAELLAAGAFNISIAGGVLTAKNANGDTLFTRDLTRAALDAITVAAP
jgi:hypothetical protein